MSKAGVFRKVDKLTGNEVLAMPAHGRGFAVHLIFFTNNPCGTGSIMLGPEDLAGFRAALDRAEAELAKRQGEANPCP